MTFPNLSLMKLAAWHRSKGDLVNWYDPVFGTYDRVYCSRIFSEEYTKPYPFPIDAYEIIRGGRVVRYVLLRGRRYTIPKKTSRCRRTSTMLIRLIGYITLRTRPTVFSLRAVPVTVRFATWRGCRARTLTILLPYPNSGAARRKSSYLTQI